MIRKAKLVTLLISALLIMQLPIAVSADSEPCDCIVTMPGVGAVSISTIYDDNAPAVWVGGDFIAKPDFAETEGLTVV